MPKAAQLPHPEVPLSSGNNSKYEPILAVLSKIQDGYDHREIAWFYQLSTEQIEEWHQSALALRALTTEKQLPRLFPRSRRHQLLPPEPLGVAEKRDVAKALAGCRVLYRPSQQRDELKWLVRYTLTNSNSSRSRVRFDDAETFHRYMAVASQLFDWPRWRLQLRHTDKNIIKRWQCGPLNIQPYRMKQKARFEQGSGWLTLRHQEEADRKEPDKTGYASHSLRIVLHRLAIIFFRANELTLWQAETN